MQGSLLWSLFSLPQDPSLCLSGSLGLSVSLSWPLSVCVFVSLPGSWLSISEPHWPRRTTSLPSPPQCWSYRWWTRRPGLWQQSSW